MKLLPTGKRWIFVGIQLLIVVVLGISATIYCTSMPGRSYVGAFEPLNPTETEIRDRLREHVEVLAGKIGRRDITHYDGLNAAADYIRMEFRGVGFEPANEAYVVDNKMVSNIVVQIPGASLADEIVVVGAHYDSITSGPGANDNASGVAALLELARFFQEQRFLRSVYLVAFANEEPPYFQTGNMGSRVYAKKLREQRANVVAMYSLETIGCYMESPGSQKYPFPFSLYYPDRGNFIGFVGNTSSRFLVRESIKRFRESTSFPSEGVAAPGFLTGIGWSDQWSFWQEGYAGVMVTDTALFRYRYYHTLSDTPDKLDYERMARVVLGLSAVVDWAASGAPRN